MSVNIEYSSQGVAASALRWWQDAGVDTLVDALPTPWLADDKEAPAARSAPETVASLPDSLDKLINWLANSDEFAPEAPAGQRVTPFGTPGSELMVITDMPDLADISSGALMTGEIGTLFDNMLRAVNLDRTSIYCVSLSPGRPATGRLEETRQSWLGEIARHHIRLAGPKKVWLLGQATSRAIAGMDATTGPSQLLQINHEGGIVPAIASVHPRLLVQHPKLKSRVWADMQLLLGD